MKRAVILLLLLRSITFILPIALGGGFELPKTAADETTQQGASKQAVAEEDRSGLVSLDFEGADIRDVIKILTTASGMNMVIGEDVQAKVTISLKNVTWEEALEVIARTYNFAYKKEKELIRIMTFEKVKQEEKDIPLTTKVFYLNFAAVVDLKDTLMKMLSGRGTIEIDKRTNSMVVTDIPAKIEEVEQIAKVLDTRTPQVMIEAMLVDVKLTEDDELGINWNIVHVDRDKLWRDKTVSTSNNYIEQPSALSSLSGAAIKFGWLQKMGSFRLNGLIQAWAKSDKAKILASPKVLTLDNQQATIEIVLEIPYKSNMNEQGNVSYSFKEVGTKLYVTPHITSGGFVSMNLKPEMSYQSGSTSDGQPIIDTRKAETNVLVNDGETIVIGGLRRVDNSQAFTKVPFLGDIPILGALFRKKDKQQTDMELLMFVTPYIVIKPHITNEEYEKYQWLEEMKSEKINKEEGKRQASLSELKPSEDIPLSDIEQTPSLPEIEEGQEQSEIEDEEGYIYSW